jgi:methylenetetrahydrofolate reductase (NADPH)
MLFDSDAYGRFMDLCAKTRLEIPVLPGTRVLKSRSQAMKMAAKFKVHIPEAILSELPEAETPDSIERGVEIFMKLVERLRRLGAPGIHLFVIADSEGAKAALRKLGPAR